MTSEPVQGGSLLEWATAARTHPAEIESGDHCLVHEFAGGTLIGVVDGLGHGAEAARAGKLAVATMQEFADESLQAIVQRCHTALLGTRGAVLSLASFDRTGMMAWTGVGNVEAHLFRLDEGGTLRKDSITLRGGVVGYQMPPIAVHYVRVTAGDALVLATDGIEDDFARYVALHETPQTVADRILARGATGRDDALVLVARYLGPLG